MDPLGLVMTPPDRGCKGESLPVETFANNKSQAAPMVKPVDHPVAEKARVLAVYPVEPLGTPKLYVFVSK